MLGGDNRKTLRKQVIVCVPGFDFHNVTGFAEVINRLNQQQFDPAVGSFREPLEHRSGRLGHNDRPVLDGTLVSGWQQSLGGYQPKLLRAPNSRHSVTF
jgi:hypothetical protein